MPILPAPLRAYIGLVATAVETAQGLIQRAPELPVEAVGNTMQLSMKVQQRYQELVARGDELLSHLIGPPAQPPGWATFDEDEADSGAASGAAGTDRDVASGEQSAFDTEFDDAVLDDITMSDASTFAVFDDDPVADASAAAVFDDDPIAPEPSRSESIPPAVLDAGIESSPTVTHGDPLLSETPVLTLPTKKPGRRTSGAARRRVSTAPAGPAGVDADADGVASGAADADSAGSGNPDSAARDADTDQLTGPGNPAPAKVDTMEAIPVEAVMAELADATPIAAVPSARKSAASRSTPARRSPRSRPRQAGESVDGSVGSAVPEAGQPPTTDPAVQQPAEPTTATSDSDAAPMS